MDTHLRPYFSVGLPSTSQNVGVRSTQMEVDAALYSRALESIDPPVSKKIFVDLGIVPGIICQPWFTSLFVGALPPEYVNRIWDVFLYEGVSISSITLPCYSVFELNHRSPFPFARCALFDDTLPSIYSGPNDEHRTCDSQYTCTPASPVASSNTRVVP
jgi:hypothetical protein